MNRSTKAWLVALVSLVVAIAAAGWGYRVPACQEEDGGPYPCVWDGPTRGNLTGDQVIILRDDR